MSPTDRCINADPNYGFAWFHCRLHPNDIPSLVLNTARLKITQELLHSQNVYARGLLHYIYRCSLKLLKMHRKIGATDDDGFSSSELSLCSSIDLITIAPPVAQVWPSSDSLLLPHIASRDIDVHDEKSRSLEVPTGSLHVDPSLSKSMHSSQGDILFVAQEDPVGVQLDRISELIEDITSALPTLSSSLLLPSSASQFVPFIQTREGTLYCYSDFVTGLVELNRSFTHNQLASDAKRSLLLGADFIVS
jgi:hypothetical protein